MIHTHLFISLRNNTSKEPGMYSWHSGESTVMQIYRLWVLIQLVFLGIVSLDRHPLAICTRLVCAQVLESPGIWTYRSIFLIISIQEFSRYTASKIWVYLCVLKVREFIEKVLEFDIGKSWNLRCQNVYEPVDVTIIEAKQLKSKELVVTKCPVLNFIIQII